MTRNRWTAVVAAVVLAAASALFFTCFERRTEAKYRGSSFEAQQNPYLAWQLLLERMGHEVKILEGPGDFSRGFPDVSATIFYPARRLTLGKERSERLLDWVEAGGHLWVTTWTLWDDEDRRPDFLLDPLGVRQFATDAPTEGDEAQTEPTTSESEPDDVQEEAAEDDGEEGASAPDSMANAWPGVRWDEVELSFGQGENRYTAYFDRDFWLETPDVEPVAAIRGETGAHLVRVQHGLGFVTVVTDDYLIRNDGLGNVDHAEVALRLLLRKGRGPQLVWILPVENWPGFLGLVRKHGWAVLMAGSVWLLAWAWRAGRRFGPLILEKPPVRRSLLEHIEAAGHLLARGRRDVLVEAARDALGDELRARRPGWLRMRPEELEKRLAGTAALQPAEVTDALRGEDVASSRNAFTHTIATLERIRHTL
ncbi:MAG: DUF4350 domain-containing protein [Deltaproteobacteria bacterium]|nr:DUF4350 domain-containing protein [Deltaproteobacteria bacterium]MBW2393212.1 DUF4350 domain-containing protein [Deltaproteobacteria bacterium]